MQATKSIDDNPGEGPHTPENRSPDAYRASQKAREGNRRQEGDIGPKEKKGSP